MLTLYPNAYYRAITLDLRHRTELMFTLESVALLQCVTYPLQYYTITSDAATFTMYFTSDDASIRMLREIAAYCAATGFDFTFTHKPFEGGAR